MTPAEIARSLTVPQRQGLLDAWECGTRLAEVSMATVRSMFRKGLVKNDDGYCPPPHPARSSSAQDIAGESL